MSDILEACRGTSIIDAIRAAVEANHQTLWHMMPCVVNEDTKDGHVGVLQPAIMGTVQDAQGKTTNVNYPLLADAPITNHQGGNMVHTMPLKKGDEVMALLASRPIDTWWATGGTSNAPIDVRANSISDPIIVRGMRSNPRKLKWVNNTASHIRSVDAKQTIEHHPTTGFHAKHVDPNDTSADNDDPTDNTKGPFNNAKKFFDHLIHPTNGHAYNAIDNTSGSGTTHTVSLDHATHTISMYNGNHTRVVNQQGITDTTSASHTTSAQTEISRTSQQSNIVDTAKALIHNGPTNVQGTLGVSQLTSMLGGLRTGALEVAADQDGGLVQITQGLLVSGIFTIQGLSVYLNDAAAAAAGVPYCGLYLNGNGGLQVCQRGILYLSATSSIGITGGL